MVLGTYGVIAGNITLFNSLTLKNLTLVDCYRFFYNIDWKSKDAYTVQNIRVNDVGTQSNVGLGFIHNQATDEYYHLIASGSSLATPTFAGIGTLTDNTNGTLNATWTAGTSAQTKRYRVFIKPLDATDLFTSAYWLADFDDLNITISTLADGKTTLTVGTTYYVGVRCYDQYDEHDANEVSLNCAPTTATITITNKQVQGATTGTVNRNQNQTVAIQCDVSASPTKVAFYINNQEFPMTLDVGTTYKATIPAYYLATGTYATTDAQFIAAKIGDGQVADMPVTLVIAAVDANVMIGDAAIGIAHKNKPDIRIPFVI